jgi:hypothetical protein
MLRKTAVFIITVILILTSFMFPVSAATSEVTLVLSDAVVSKDGTVTVTVLLTTNSGINSFGLSYDYKTRYMSVTSVDNGNVFPDSQFTYGSRGITFDTNDTTNNTNTGTLCVIHLKLKDTTVAMDSPLTFNLTESGLASLTSSGTVYNPTYSSNKVNIYFLRGDVNLDGLVNAKDLLLLRKSLVGLTTLTATQLKTADVLQDSIYDAADVLALRKLLVGIS